MNRDEFPILNQDLIYLDNGATTLKPKRVVDKMVDYYEKYTSNIHRGDYNNAIKTNEEYDNVRNIVKDFINAEDPNEIVYTSGTTESLNLAVFGFFKNKLSEGDEVLISKAEHASNVLPWLALEKEKKIKELLDLKKPKRELIEALIDKIVIDKDRNITIKFKYDVIPQIDFTYVEENKVRNPYGRCGKQ